MTSDSPNENSGNGKKKSGRAATISAIAGLVIAVGTAGTQVYKTVWHEEEAKVSQDLQLQDAYLLLREANVKAHKRINRLARSLNRAQGQIQLLTAFHLGVTAMAAAPRRDRDRNEIRQPDIFRTTTAAASSYDAETVPEMDEVDVLADLPDEIAIPDADYVAAYIQKQE